MANKFRLFLKKMLRRISTSYRILDQLHNYGLEDEKFTIQKNGMVFLKEFDLCVDCIKHDFILKGLRYLRNLKNYRQAAFTIMDTGLIIEVVGLNLTAKTTEELYILNEVFASSVYNLDSRRSAVFVDIGMNVAYTSLFLATKTNVRKIYGYEPFKENYQDALANISQNPIYSEKILPFNFGISDYDKNLECEFSSESKGRGGVNPLSRIAQAGTVIKKETIHLVDIRTILKQIIDENSNCEIALKIDCEGSEYEIINRLCGSSYFKYITSIMLEWHRLGKQSLLENLLSEGFTTISIDTDNGIAGMIYAIRQSEQ